MPNVFQKLSAEGITPDNYQVPKGEERLYHVKIEVKQYNPKTGEKISVPQVQKFGPKIYKALVEKNLRKLGYEIVVLHNPETWLKENADKLARLNAEKEAKRVALIAAEKEKMKAEILAELRDSGIIPATETEPQGQTSEQTTEQGEKRGPGRPAKDKEN